MTSAVMQHQDSSISFPQGSAASRVLPQSLTTGPGITGPVLYRAFVSGPVFWQYRAGPRTGPVKGGPAHRECHAYVARRLRTVS